MQNLYSLEFFSRRFSVTCVPFSMLGGPSETGYDEVHILVHGGWGSGDVSVAGIRDCVKKSMSFVM